MDTSESESESQPSLSNDSEEGEQPPSAQGTTPVVGLVDVTKSLDEDTMAWLEEATRQLVMAMAEDGVEIGRVSARLIGDEEMGRAHLDYAGVEGTTDVLAFLACADPLEVDVLACVDEAQRRAHEFGHELQQEVMLYMVHAILHGLGHDDSDLDSSQRMYAEEARLLARIGVGPVLRPHDEKGASQ